MMHLTTSRISDESRFSTGLEIWPDKKKIHVQEIRSGLVSNSCARGPDSIPGGATSRPTKAFHLSNLWAEDKLAPSNEAVMAQ